MVAGVPAVPDSVPALLTHLKHPVRLPLLMALEGRELSAAQLQKELGSGEDQVNYALRRLKAAGLVVVVRSERTSPTTNTLRQIYATQRHDWTQLVDTLATYADPANDGRR
jgi:DNA-binding GntR family transcriptional regulator